MKSKTDKILLIVSFLFMLVGVGIFLYPTVSNYFATKNQTTAIRTYDEKIEESNEEELKEELEKAKEYNENLAGDPVHDPFVEGSGYALPENYTDVLNITDDGIMAYIEIPKISVYLPIYHGTSEEVLQKGVGHIESTSLPIGGTSTHSVLTGHTGLPSAELFTKIDELVVGDFFYIHVLDQLLTYVVYETKVILPDEIDELQITNGEDYITLVTCTPYGVNTHRLLVKAKRSEYMEYTKIGLTENSQGDTTPKHKNYYLRGILIGIPIFIITIIILGIIIKVVGNKRGGKHEEKKK